MDQKIEELMWLEIDGTITPDDSRTLHAYLETHKEGLEHFEELQKMASLFGQVGEVEPPPELRGRILRSLEMAAAPSAPGARLVERVRGFFLPSPVWRLAAATAIGVIIGIIGYHFVSYDAGPGAPLDKSRFYGTMNVGSVDRTGPVLNIDVPGATGALSIHRDNECLWSELRVTSEIDIEVVLEYPGSTVRFAGGDLSDDPSNQVTIEKGAVRVRNRGEGTYRFLFELHEEPTFPVVVKVLSGGNVLLEDKAYPDNASKRR